MPIHSSTRQIPGRKSGASSPASPASLPSTPTRPSPSMNQCTDESMNQSPQPTVSNSAFFRFPVSSFMSPAPRRLVVGYVSFGSRLVVGWWSVTCRLVVDWWSVMCRFLQATFGLNPCQSSPPSQNPPRNSITTTKTHPNRPPSPVPPWPFKLPRPRLPRCPLWLQQTRADPTTPLLRSHFFLHPSNFPPPSLAPWSDSRPPCIILSPGRQRRIRGTQPEL